MVRSETWNKSESETSISKRMEKLIVKQQANGVIPRAKKEWSEIFPEQRLLPFTSCFVGTLPNKFFISFWKSCWIWAEM